MEDICYDIIPILGSSAGYREKRSHNRMIGSPWTSPVPTGDVWGLGSPKQSSKPPKLKHETLSVEFLSIFRM